MAVDIPKMMAALPERVRRLPVDHRGFPVPWFVQWFDVDKKPVANGVGTPDFRVIDPARIFQAVKQSRCWVCGDPLGVHKAFVIGPMCAINRVNSEPPSHRDCGTFSARFCPFLSQPRMKRNEKDLPAGRDAAGFGLKRNPGLACLWVTRDFKMFRPNKGNDGVLFSLGPPEAAEWWAEGRPATRAEVDESINTGLPSLMELAVTEKGGVEALNAMVARAQPLLPP